MGKEVKENKSESIVKEKDIKSFQKKVFALKGLT